MSKLNMFCHEQTSVLLLGLVTMPHAQSLTFHKSQSKPTDLPSLTHTSTTHNDNLMIHSLLPADPWQQTFPPFRGTEIHPRGATVQCKKERGVHDVVSWRLNQKKRHQAPRFQHSHLALGMTKRPSCCKGSKESTKWGCQETTDTSNHLSAVSVI